MPDTSHATTTPARPKSITERRRVVIPSDYPRKGRLADQRLFETVLGVGTSTFERLKAAERLPSAIRIGRTLRWDEAVIAATAANGIA